MKRLGLWICFLICSISLFSSLVAQENPYTWLPSYSPQTAIENQVNPPEGFFRPIYPKHSFGDWLRKLPVDTLDQIVNLYNGERKYNQEAHTHILNIPVGKRDLQQCADAVMRLKAEYQFSQKKFEDIHFDFTNGEKASYVSWREGYRPVISGNTVNWRKSAGSNPSYASFLKYMNIIFSYAGTYSFSKECKHISTDQAKIGDLFIQGGFPGHAVIIVDEAINTEGEKMYLLAQSYMPAQQIHILKNPQNPSLSPWYRLSEATLLTPEWSFPRESIKRMNW